MRNKTCEISYIWCQSGDDRRCEDSRDVPDEVTESLNKGGVSAQIKGVYQ